MKRLSSPFAITLLSAAALRAAAPRRARLIHIGHDVPHAEIARRYGPAVLPTYDGETFEL